MSLQIVFLYIKKLIFLMRSWNECLRKYLQMVKIERMCVLSMVGFWQIWALLLWIYDSLEDRWNLEPMFWWYVHGSSLPIPKSRALKIFGQPYSSSCCERNCNTYIQLYLGTKLFLIKRVEYLVHVHTNLQLFSRIRKSTIKEYLKSRTL